MDSQQHISSVSEFINIISSITENPIEIAKSISERLIGLSYNNNNSDRLQQYYKAIVEEHALSYSQDEILCSVDDESDNSTKIKFFYRGHYSLDYLLNPSVFRGNNWKKEDFFYHEIMVRCPEHFQYSSHLDKLVTMQHYNCPTRLLDVTSNPLVALYFACKNFECKNCNCSDKGQVFVFPVNSNDVAYSDSDRVLMLSCLARFSTKEKDDLLEKAFKYLSAEKFKQISGGSRYSDEIVERFYHEIATELPSFKREIKPIDILKPLFIQPNKTNGRILKQDGAFIINGLSTNEKEARNKIESISHRSIIVENKSKILGELSSLGIHEAALFPEVDKVANYLKEQDL